MEIKKEKIKSILHSENMRWIRVRDSSKPVQYINETLKKFDSQIKRG